MNGALLPRNQCARSGGGGTRSALPHTLHPPTPGTAEPSLFAVIPDMLLAGWLSARSTGLGDATTLSTDLKLRTLRPISPGETLLEIRSGGLLTPAVAYADREFGRDISSYAAQLGVGFGSVALATYLTAERVRGFGAATWFAGSSAETGGSISASEYSPLTKCHWSLKAPVVDPDVRPLVTRGIELVLPLCELAARRAWSSRQVWGEDAAGGVGGSATVDDVAQWSRDELVQLIEESFAIVLSRQWPEPPPCFAEDGISLVDHPASSGAADQLPRAWGFGASAPSGPALLPPIQGCLLHASEDDYDDGEANAVVGVPPRPILGNKGEGICLRCVATRSIQIGEAIVT